MLNISRQIVTFTSSKLAKISDIKTGRHHRRPRRHGGTSHTRNIILLPMRSHDAWHRLFNHLYATNIAGQINRWRHFHGMQVLFRRSSYPEYPDLSELVYREHIRDTPTPAQAEAWSYLFGELSKREIVFQMNMLYLDRDYRFFLRR